MTSHDRRLHAYRADLADVRLRGEVSADRFVEGRAARVAVPVADVRRTPSGQAPLDTQLLLGDAVDIFEETNGFAWVQARRDGYVGHVAVEDLAEPGEEATHRVIVPRSFVYPGPDLRFPRADVLSMGSEVTVVGETETRGTRYAVLSDSRAIIAVHLAPIDARMTDYVAVAETFLQTPYLWGGVSGFGIDCSGLVQLSMRLSGRDVLRDSDMQAAEFGEPLDPGEDYRNLRRGDLVFWRGHVAIMTDGDSIVHASGHTMAVSCEALRDAVDRIGYLYNRPTGFRRP